MTGVQTCALPISEINKAVDMQSVMREIKNAEFQEAARLKRIAESLAESQKKIVN